MRARNDRRVPSGWRSLALLLGLACLSAPSAIRAEVLVQYDFDNSNTAATAANEWITPADFYYSGGGVTSYPSGHASPPSFSTTYWSTNDVLEDYFGFDFAVEPGFIVDVTSLSFYEQRSETGPKQWVARYSVDGGTWHTLGNGNNAESWGAIDVTESAAAPDLSGTVYFRIYGTNATSHSGTWRVDEVAVNGSIRIDDGRRVIRARDFDGTHLDTWPTTTNVAGGAIAASPDEQASGARSLKISGSAAGNTNQNAVLANTDISGAEDVFLSVVFASETVDTDDDLYLDLSFDNGVTWDGAGSVKLVDGSNQFTLAFGATDAERTVTSNPWTIDIAGAQTQVAVRVRFEESNNDNSDDHYYVDDIRLIGITEPPAISPVIRNYLAATDVGETAATVRAHVQRGYPFPVVTLYWGPADGGTNAGSWSHETSLGTNAYGIATNTLTALSPGTFYYYRFHAENEHGSDWADNTTNFTTAAGAIASIKGLFIDSIGIGTSPPLCIDRDANGLSDVWENEYLGGIGQDAYVDSDGDGITNLYEQIAGTNPNDAGSYMHLLSLDLAAPASADILVFLLGGNYRGTSEFMEAGDSNQRRFRIRASDNPGVAKTPRAVVPDAGAGTNIWIDTNMVNEAAARYYEVSVSYAGGAYTNTEEWAVYVQQRPAGRKFLVCVPVDMVSAADENLNSIAGRQLARGLSAASESEWADGDKLRFRDANWNWKEYNLVTNTAGEPYWYDSTSFTTADVPVTAGMAMWLVRGAGDVIRTNAVFAGKSFSDSAMVNKLFTTNYGGWTEFGWPLAHARSHSNTNSAANQLGFASRGSGGKSSTQGDGKKGDEIWIWNSEEADWRRGIWLIGNSGTAFDGRWWDSHSGGFADLSLEPGQAYYYRHRVNDWGGTNFTWKPETP